jgi:hypothetical protein
MPLAAAVPGEVALAAALGELVISAEPQAAKATNIDKFNNQRRTPAAA